MAVKGHRYVEVLLFHIAYVPVKKKFMPPPHYHVVLLISHMRISVVLDP